LRLISSDNTVNRFRPIRCGTGALSPPSVPSTREMASNLLAISPMLVLKPYYLVIDDVDIVPRFFFICPSPFFTASDNPPPTFPLCLQALAQPSNRPFQYLGTSVDVLRVSLSRPSCTSSPSHSWKVLLLALPCNKIPSLCFYPPP
jgi:hypothetical protein